MAEESKLFAGIDFERFPIRPGLLNLSASLKLANFATLSELNENLKMFKKTLSKLFECFKSLSNSGKARKFFGTANIAAR